MTQQAPPQVEPHVVDYAPPASPWRGRLAVISPAMLVAAVLTAGLFDSLDVWYSGRSPGLVARPHLALAPLVHLLFIGACAGGRAALADSLFAAPPLHGWRRSMAMAPAVTGLLAGLLLVFVGLPLLACLLIEHDPGPFQWWCREPWRILHDLPRKTHIAALLSATMLSAAALLLRRGPTVSRAVFFPFVKGDGRRCWRVLLYFAAVAAAISLFALIMYRVELANAR